MRGRDYKVRKVNLTNDLKEKMESPWEKSMFRTVLALAGL